MLLMSELHKAVMLLLVNCMLECSSRRQDVSAGWMRCHCLLNVAICSRFMSVNCRRGLFVAIILRVANELFIQSACDYTFCTLIRPIGLLLWFCTLIQPISVLLQFFALFMVTSKQHNTGLIALFNGA